MANVRTYEVSAVVKMTPIRDDVIHQSLASYVEEKFHEVKAAFSHLYNVTIEDLVVTEVKK